MKLATQRGPRARGRPQAAARTLALALSTFGACAQAPDGAAADPTAPEAKPKVEVRAAVDKAVATTGDIITYEVVIERPLSIEVEVPEPGAELAGFRIVDLGVESEPTRDGRIRERRWYKLRADLVGSYILPPVRAAYRAPESPEGPLSPERDRAPESPKGAPPVPSEESPSPSEDAPPAKTPPQREDEASPAPDSAAEATAASVPLKTADGREVITTSAIFVEVASVLPEDGSATDIRGLKPLRRIEVGLPGWAVAAILAGALLLTALIAGLISWRRRAVEIQASPPHQIAFAALGSLRQTDFSDPEAVRRYYFQISEVIRAYLEGRYPLNATDLTTEEIVARLEELQDLGPSPRQTLIRFLADTDRVKFADHVPSEEEIGEAYERALSFVEKTQPRPQAAAVAAA